MEINSYQKLKDNIYVITLDNGTSLKLYDETIIKFGLLTKKALTSPELMEITKANDALRPYYIALKYLVKKMRSCLEVKHYLAGKGYDDKTIKKTIELLESQGHLNDQQFMISYINDQIILTNQGPLKIKANLMKLGIDEASIKIEVDFRPKLENLIAKKVALNHKLSTNALKHNLTNYLINLGYELDMFTNLLADISLNETELIKHDYDCLMKKYDKKYQNKQLKLFIRDKLYRKGYNIEVINEVMNEDIY